MDSNEILRKISSLKMNNCVKFESKYCKQPKKHITLKPVEAL